MLLRSGRLLESLLFFKCILSRFVLYIPRHSCRVVALCCGKPGGMEGHPGGLGITPDNLLLTGYYQPMAPPASNTSTTPVLLYYKTRSSIYYCTSTVSILNGYYQPQHPAPHSSPNFHHLAGSSLFNSPFISATKLAKDNLENLDVDIDQSIRE